MFILKSLSHIPFVWKLYSKKNITQPYVTIQVTLPFFVLHGEADIVTDPEVSRALYEKASSRDKTIKLYPGMWHGLTSGEPDENIEIVFSDIIDWLDKHSAVGGGNLVGFQLQSTRSVGNGVERFNGQTTFSNEKEARRSQNRGSYLCGLKGRLQSAM